METEAPQPLRGLPLRLFWTLLALVVLGYPLSLGPVAYWYELNQLKSDPAWFKTYAWPARWLHDNAEVVAQPLVKYVGFWEDLADKQLEARRQAPPVTPTLAPAP